MGIGIGHGRPLLARRLIFVPVVLAALSSCATVPGSASRPSSGVMSNPLVVSLRSKLTEGANSLIGKKGLSVRGREFNMDCTGVILAVYWYAGIDLARDFERYTGNGVARIFKSLERAGLLYDTKYPVSGDLIFWDDTYDADGDGKWDDPLTHVGMVVATASDGTVSYIHHHTRRGIVIEYMNLLEPGVNQKSEWGKTRIVNSPMRLAEPGVPHPARWLAGQLYRILGMGYLF